MDSIKGLIKRLSEMRFSFLKLELLIVVYFSFTFSYLKRSLIEETLSDSEQKASESMLLSEFGHLELLYDVSECDWMVLLLQPAKLIKLLLRYHHVENLAVAVLHTIVTMYLWTKILFHVVYTKKDEELAEHFANHYYPRFLESHPQPYRYNGIFLSICTVMIILRLVTFRDLLRRSILNQNGYRHVHLSQLNIPVLKSLHLPLKDWLRFWPIAIKHRKICRRNDETNDGNSATERLAHLYHNQHILDKLRSSRKRDLYCLENIVDFSQCYRHFDIKLDRKHVSREYWCTPNGQYRLDLWELCWFLMFLNLATAILVSFVSFVLVSATFHELSLLTPDPRRAKIIDCLYEVPNMLKNWNRFIRILDIYLMSFTQVPVQSELIIAFLNICTISSRARKVDESLKECYEFCEQRAQQYENSNGTNPPEDISSYASQSSDEEDEEQIITCGRNSPANGNVSSHIRFRRVSKCMPAFALSSNLNSGLSYDSSKLKYDNISRDERKLLYKNIEINLRLSQLIRGEFISERESFTSYLNVLFVGSGFCVAFTVALCYSDNSAPLLTFAPIASIVYSLSPVVFILPACIVIERRVSCQNEPLQIIINF